PVRLHLCREDAGVRLFFWFRPRKLVYANPARVVRARCNRKVPDGSGGTVQVSRLGRVARRRIVPGPRGSDLTHRVGVPRGRARRHGLARRVAPQGLHELLAPWETLIRVLGERATHSLAVAGRQASQIGTRAEMLHDELPYARAVERPLAREQLLVDD